MNKKKKIIIALVLVVCFIHGTVSPAMLIGADQTVYTTETGKKYHKKKSCKGLNNARNIYTTTESQAKSRGLTKCSICWKSSGSSSKPKNKNIKYYAVFPFNDSFKPKNMGIKIKRNKLVINTYMAKTKGWYSDGPVNPKKTNKKFRLAKKCKIYDCQFEVGNKKISKKRFNQLVKKKTYGFISFATKNGNIVKIRYCR